MPPADGTEELAAPEGTEPGSTEPGVPGPARSGADKLLEVDETVQKVQFCHWKPAASNPYEFPETSVNAFFNSGHNDHENDVVPPFEYLKSGEPTLFPGLNWDAAGEQLWNDDCEVARPTIAVTPAQCLPGGEPTDVNVFLYGLTDGELYTVGIRDSDKDPIVGIDDVSFEATSSTKMIEFTGLPETGTYWAFLEFTEFDGAQRDRPENGGMDPIWVMFALDECPPVIPTIAVDPVVCQDGQQVAVAAKIKLGSLAPEQQYRLSIYDANGVLVSSVDPLLADGGGPVKEITVTGLPEPGTYRLVLEWADDKIEAEHPIVPSSETDPLQLCSTSDLALASTGFGSSPMPLGLGLLTIGTAVMLGTRMMRRQHPIPPMV